MESQLAFKQSQLELFSMIIARNQSACVGRMLCEVASYLEPECSDFGEAERRRSFTLTTVPSRVFQPTLSLWMLKETPAISSIPPLGSSRKASSTRLRAVERV